jgi:hypothetical protein
MTDSFDHRGKSLEGKAMLEEEVGFKVQAKAVKMFGHWAAQQLGLAGDEAEAYAVEVLDSDVERAGVGDVMEKVQRDLAAKGIEMTLHHLENEYKLHLQVAVKQVAGD